MQDMQEGNMEVLPSRHSSRDTRGRQTLIESDQEDGEGSEGEYLPPQEHETSDDSVPDDMEHKEKEVDVPLRKIKKRKRGQKSPSTQSSQEDESSDPGLDDDEKEPLKKGQSISTDPRGKRYGRKGVQNRIKIPCEFCGKEIHRQKSNLARHFRQKHRPTEIATEKECEIKAAEVMASDVSKSLVAAARRERQMKQLILKGKKQDPGTSGEELVENKRPKDRREKFCVMCENTYSDVWLKRGHFNEASRSLCTKWDEWWTSSRAENFVKPIVKPKTDQEETQHNKAMRALLDISVYVKHCPVDEKGEPIPPSKQEEIRVRYESAPLAWNIEDMLDAYSMFNRSSHGKCTVDDEVYKKVVNGVPLSAEEKDNWRRAGIMSNTARRVLKYVFPEGNILMREYNRLSEWCANKDDESAFRATKKRGNGDTLSPGTLSNMARSIINLSHWLVGEYFEHDLICRGIQKVISRLGTACSTWRKDQSTENYRDKVLQVKSKSMDIEEMYTYLKSDFARSVEKVLNE